MYSGNFEYHRAATLAEAITLLSQNDEAKVIAGGHSLLPAMKLRLAEPPMLIDIGGLDELRGIHVNGGLRIGALTTHGQVAASAEVRQHCAVLADACGMVGDIAVRNWGTLGGNLAHADPASDPPTVMLAVGATIHVEGPNGARAIRADDFFVDLFTTALAAGELVRQIEVPSMAGKHAAYAKMAQPASGYAMVGVCVVLEMDGAACKTASIAVGGATPKATRAKRAERALAGTSLDGAALDAAAKAIAEDIGDEAMGDIHGSADYRRHMAGVYLKRALAEARG
jgi:carbon-monoxide dehydrogenase medium subunit